MIEVNEAYTHDRYENWLKSVYWLSNIKSGHPAGQTNVIDDIYG